MNRVVITGIGAITPIGSGRDGLWGGVQAGKSAVRAITRFDPSAFRSRIAAEVGDFDPLAYVDARHARRLDRFTQFAIAASRQAIEDAGYNLEGSGGSQRPLQHAAIYLGSALGGIAFAEEQHTRFLSEGFRAVEPALALVVFGGSAATSTAIELGVNGPIVGNANSCASGLIAVGEAFRLLRHGQAELALAGGVEAPLAPLTFGAFARIKAMSTRNETPSQASRPFDRTRDGFVMGEGAAVLVLENLDRAHARGRRPYAEILGYGVTNDAFHMTEPRADGAEAARAMRNAMTEARVEACEIDYVNAHATGTPLGDRAEARAIRSALGEHADCTLVSGTKGLHGHALGASGAIEVAITALAVAHGWLPPTANLTDPDPACQLCHVLPPGADRLVELALTNSFGFGGINATLVLRRWR